MGILTDELRKPRWSGGGLVLIAVLLPLLAYPLLRTRDINHPLSAKLEFDLCARLPPPPAALPQPLHRVGQSANFGISCELRDQDKKPVLNIFLTTTRSASVSGPQRTSAMYETWVKEAKASGAIDVLDRLGPWAMAQSFRYGSNQQMLVEDHGVLLFLSSTSLGADDIAQYARDTVAALRATEP
jgi:hypothetical protein